MGNVRTTPTSSPTMNRKNNKQSAVIKPKDKETGTTPKKIRNINADEQVPDVDEQIVMFKRMQDRSISKVAHTQSNPNFYSKTPPKFPIPFSPTYHSKWKADNLTCHDKMAGNSSAHHERGGGHNDKVGLGYSLVRGPMISDMGMHTQIVTNIKMQSHHIQSHQQLNNPGQRELANNHIDQAMLNKQGEREMVSSQLGRVLQSGRQHSNLYQCNSLMAQSVSDLRMHKQI